MYPLLYTLKPGDLPEEDQPYGHFEGPIALGRIPSYLPKGGAVGVRPHPGSSWTELEDVIGSAARRVVNAPLVLWPDCIGHDRAVECAAKARLLGVRAVVWNAQPLTRKLRAQLTDSTDWPETAVWWLRRRAIDLTPEAERLLRALARYGAQHRTIGALAAAVDVEESHLRRTLTAMLPGQLHDWHQVLRCVAIGIEIQRDPNVTMAAIAYKLGYSTASKVSDRLDQIIGARPTYIRSHLGWHWMIADALHRQRLGIL